MCQLQTFHLEQLRVREDVCLMPSPQWQAADGPSHYKRIHTFHRGPKSTWICAVVHLTHSSTVNSPIPFSPHPGCICESVKGMEWMFLWQRGRMGDSWVLPSGPICLLSWMCNGPSWCDTIHVLSSSPKPSLLLFTHAWSQSEQKQPRPACRAKWHVIGVESTRPTGCMPQFAMALWNRASFYFRFPLSMSSHSYFQADSGQCRKPQRLW